MFIPSTYKRPVSSWKALNLRKTLLMASSVRLKPLNCSRLPCVYAQETLTFLLRSEERFSRNAETDLVCRLLLEKKNRRAGRVVVRFGEERRKDSAHRRTMASQAGRLIELH